MSANPPFDIYFGVDGWMLSMLSCGMNPVTSVIDVVCQVAMMGLLRFVSLFYLMDFGRITQKCHCEKMQNTNACKVDWEALIIILSKGKTNFLFWRFFILYNRSKVIAPPLISESATSPVLLFLRSMHTVCTRTALASIHFPFVLCIMVEHDTRCVHRPFESTIRRVCQ